MREYFNKKYIIVNSPERTGGTFLSNLLRYYIEWNGLQENIKLYSHMHDPFLHRVSDFENDQMFSILRKPEDTVSSLFLYISHLPKDIKNIGNEDFDKIINRVFDHYIVHYYEFLKNPICKMIIFENLINVPELVISNIFNQMGYPIVIDKNPKEILLELSDAEDKMKMPIYSRHYPIESIASSQELEYKRLIKEYIRNNELMKISQQLYDDVLNYTLK